MVAATALVVLGIDAIGGGICTIGEENAGLAARVRVEDSGLATGVGGAEVTLACEFVVGCPAPWAMSHEPLFS